MPNSIANKLLKLRALMKQHHLDYYYIPSRDEHNNEYLPNCWKRREYISGFDGSAGDVLIGQNIAYLWTDPRYFLQASQQLDSSLFTLMKQQQGIAAPIHQWLEENAAHKRVGTDPKVISIFERKLWENALSKNGGELVSIEENLIDSIWEDQESLPRKPIFVLDTQFTGLDTHTKLSQLRQALKEKHAEAHALDLLDAIAWLFNIRGNDINFNPLAISYALITDTEATIFVDQEKIDDAAQAYFSAQKISVKPYSVFPEALNAYRGRILLEEKTASWWMEKCLHNATIVRGQSPITLMKALKNPVEQAGMAKAHHRDGIALCKIFHWIEHHWDGSTELDVTDNTEKFRAADPHFKGLSFRTIAGYADHGAIIHYSASKATNKAIGDQNLLLLDSGAQYLEGTTDVTRTIHLGTPTAAQITHYTLVLKGHLALRHTIFPHGICGEQLNAIAHAPLWSQGLDFGHGTGHGVGCFLCVHEGPQRISGAYTQVPLLPGMIVSNEPGFYLDGSYGIRIENLVLIVEKFPGFYGFEDLTLFPYARNLIDRHSLTIQEIEWINSYHHTVYEQLKNNIPVEIKSWLQKLTQPL